MNIFGKKANKNAIKPNEEERVEETTAHQEDTNMPYCEAPRATVGYKQLNATQLQRTKEMKRLAETKLSNLEDSLEHLRKQQEWLRNYNEVKLMLAEEKAKLFELSKQRASLSEEINQLKRYETFESIQGTFQRTMVLEKLAAQNKRNISVLERESEELKRKWDEQEKVQQQMREKSKMSADKLYNLMEPIFQTFQWLGSSENIRKEVSKLQEIQQEKKSQLELIESSIAEKEQEVQFLREEMDRHRAGRQSMEMHEQMLNHGEAILLRLDRLQEIESQQQDLKVTQQEALKRQNEENDLLSKVFTQYQGIMSEIDKLESELHTHRASIQGQNSFKLQERAMMLKSRKQMLLSAQSLWRQISTGYNVIEEKTRTLNELRLKIEHAEQNVRELETEVGKTTRLCHEKEYTYLLSKGQNIIQLRADLKEGVSCSVCGATHHPYHSDTMLDQSKLIGQFKTEYELLASEARNKQNQLTDLQLELAEDKGKRTAEEAALNSVRQRQNEDVKEWQIFAKLDKTFEECSPSTNLEARMALLRQLIENTSNDAEKAQKELDEFSFHQTQIASLSEKLQTFEQRKNELNVRLNEVNTGCQVRAGQVERVQNMLDAQNTFYREVYTTLEKNITIKDWMNIWERNRETLREQIQQLMTTWENVNHKIQSEQHELMLEEANLEQLKHLKQILKNDIEGIGAHIEKCQTNEEENQNNCNRAIGNTDPRSLFLANYQQLQEDQRAEYDEKEKSKNLLHDLDVTKGRNDFYMMQNEQLGEILTAERSTLDLWIRSFNAQNPPVQYAELESVFHEEKDWNATRTLTRGIEMEVALCQARVDDYNSRLIALQAEGGRSNQNEEKLQESLVAQQENLDSKRREIMMQIAKATLTLEEHEKAIRLANNSAMIQE